MFPYFSLKKQYKYTWTALHPCLTMKYNPFSSFFFNFEVATSIDFEYLPSVPVLQGIFGKEHL